MSILARVWTFSWCTFFLSTTRAEFAGSLSGIISRFCASPGRLLSGHRQTSMIYFFRYWIWCKLLEIFELTRIQLVDSGLERGYLGQLLNLILSCDFPVRRACCLRIHYIESGLIHEQLTSLSFLFKTMYITKPPSTNVSLNRREVNAFR